LEYKLRRIKDLTAELDDDEVVDALDIISDRLIDHAPKDGIIHISEALEELEVAEAEKGTFLGLSTGYSTLDAKMGGLEPGSVVLIGGETSNGKSMLAINIALNIAKEMTNVLYMSLEMTRKQVWKRVMAITDMTPARMAEELDFSVQESFNLEYKDIEPLVKKAVEEKGCEIIFVDYLQYLGRGMTEKEVAKMSQVIKRVALKYNVCMVVIVSLRKGSGGVEKRKWFDTEIEELMGTAALGYDADVVVITSRKNLENEFDHDKFFVKVLKNRNNRLDFHDRIVELKWDMMKITEEYRVVTGHPLATAEGWQAIHA